MKGSYYDWIMFCRSNKWTFSYWARFLSWLRRDKNYVGIDIGHGGDYTCVITYKVINNVLYIVDVENIKNEN